MRFIDECTLNVEAGKGGDGVISFRREYKVDKGGPDGGDGGHGGSIYFVGDPGTNTLYKLRLLKHIRGEDGGDGKRKNMQGANGADTLIKVPLGTLVYRGGELIADVVEARPYLIAAGGRGGRGNRKFKSTRNTVPYLSENGTRGEHFDLQLSLKVLADVGFVGKPSAGKSTVLGRLSNAQPKIADYPFTTLVPQLGVVVTDDNNTFVAADLPGLIEGAAQGKGLGLEFLRHIERCRVVAHIIDFGDPQKNPLSDFAIVNTELRHYQLNLEVKPQVVIANKADLPAFAMHLAAFTKAHPALPVVPISALTDVDFTVLKRELYRAYVAAAAPVLAPPPSEITIRLPEALKVTSPHRGLFEVTGDKVRQWYERIPLSSAENMRRFNQVMRDIGVWDALLAHHIHNGDTVRIYSYEFTWDEEAF